MSPTPHQHLPSGTPGSISTDDNSQTSRPALITALQAQPRRLAFGEPHLNAFETGPEATRLVPVDRPIRIVKIGSRSALPLQQAFRGAVIEQIVVPRRNSQARAVLEANALGMSDAIRIFLQQVVRRGGLPFAVRDPDARVSGKQLRAMERASQARDRALAQRDNVDLEAVLLLRPRRLRGARLEWPEEPAD